MKATLALILAVAGCTDSDPVTDPDLHREVDCATEWSSFFPGAMSFTCEAPCAAPPSGYTGRTDVIVCTGSYPGRLGVRELPCFDGSMHEHDGVSGCCAALSGERDVSIHFAVCVD